MDIVLIPAYKPDEELIKLVQEIYKEGLQILVVDDGSKEEYNGIFDAISNKAEIIHIPRNMGKGNALKKGFEAVLERFPECTNVITADSDGQHKVTDILRVRDKLNSGSGIVLTMRDMKGNIPARSMFGNVLSRWIYTVLTGHYLADNQSGLRGFAVKHLEWLIKVPGEKYDYEINVLFYADKQHIRIATLPIEAIYIDGNKSSHFSPVKDTIRIYKRLFSSARASILSAVICGMVMMIMSLVIGYKYCTFTIPVLGFAVSLFSILTNKYVFRNVKYKDGPRMLLYTAIRFTVYTGVCMLARIFIPKIPIAIVFYLTALLIVPIKYNIHKYIRNKE